MVAQGKRSLAGSLLEDALLQLMGKRRGEARSGLVSKIMKTGRHFQTHIFGRRDLALFERLDEGLYLGVGRAGELRLEIWSSPESQNVSRSSERGKQRQRHWRE
jgi:hypothetical protein